MHSFILCIRKLAPQIKGRRRVGGILLCKSRKDVRLIDAHPVQPEAQ